METFSTNSIDPPATEAHGENTPAPPALRATGRPATPAAAEYFDNNAIARSVALRVLFEPHLRRGHHDADGIRR